MNFLIDLMEKISGARVTHAHFVPGGVRNDLPPNFEEVCLRQVNYFEKRIREYAAVFYDNPNFNFKNTRYWCTFS